MYQAILIISVGFFLFCCIFYKAIKHECSIDCCKPIKKITPTYTVLTVKNSEDRIEGVIYSLIKKIQSNKDNPPFQNILVIDIGSSDSTTKILEKLSVRHEFIHVLRCSSYIDMAES